MPANPTGDPLLKTKEWKRAVTYWSRRRDNCARCGQPITYGGQRGPWSLDVGHITSRAEARRQGWTDTQINALSNTRPEHATCNRAAGANERNPNSRTRPEPITTGTW